MSAAVVGDSDTAAYVEEHLTRRLQLYAAAEAALRAAKP